jgi:hypothetical protein
LNTKLKSGIKIVSLMLAFLLISGCSASTEAQSKDEPSGGSVKIEGVTVSNVQLSLHGKSSLPNSACINTKLLADGSALPWWPAEKCVEVSQGIWTQTVPLEGNSLQTGTQYVIQAYLQGHQNPAATLAFDTNGPPQPSE